VGRKGYAFIEYETHKEAVAAIEAANATPLLGKSLQADFAFVKGQGGGRGSGTAGSGRGAGRRSGGGRRGRAPAPPPAPHD
jgi:RNA recognition motif-containing protein